MRSILINEGYDPKDKEFPTPSNIKHDDYFAVKDGSIRPITTHGVRLGMTEKQVLARLGPPKKSLHSKRFQARELIYATQTRKSKDGIYQKASNFYLFRGGKLYFIELARDVIGGG